MANKKLLNLLKQGVDVWNKSRLDRFKVIILPDDLSGADLEGAYLEGADLGGVNLENANLEGANLENADLSASMLINTNFKYSVLIRADLSNANLLKADLSGASLGAANFSWANLSKTNLSKVSLNATIFAGVDLSNTLGLNEVNHFGATIISMDTIQLSKGKIPIPFLRGCGLSDWEVESTKLHKPNLSNSELDEILSKIHNLRAQQPIQISPLFISYSHGDAAFVDKLENRLNKKGIRFWRDVHDAKAGRLETQIDRAIRQNPTVLLVLSERSIMSDWVEHEVRTARVLEKEMKRDVLCPVALDDSWKNSPWAKRIMEQVMEYNILDFSAWKDDGKFRNTFNKLIDGLGLFYK